MAGDLLSPASDTSYDASSIEVLEDMEHVRLRPGMYIGGKDDRALHHMVAEIIDNSMDEAVAGHATWIEVELHENGHVSVRDNGRGIPTGPHPKDPSKSALEIIFCTLNAGGKFSGDSYETSGGLHGVGSSVVNALSDHLRVEVARNKELYAMEFSRGVPQGKLARIGSAPNRRGTAVTFHPDPDIFGTLKLKPARLFKMARSKAYLFSGVEIRWKSALADGDTPMEARFHFPGGLADYLNETMAGASTYADAPFAGSVSFEKFNAPGKVEWAINWTPSRDGFIQSYCNTVPTPEGGTHEAGFWAAILKGIKAYGELVSNKKAATITREDLTTGAGALVSCFIREPEFVGQTKDRLATVDAQRMVENSVRDHFDNWLAADTKSAGAILDFLVLRAEERLRRRQEKETARKSATKKLRLPGKLVDCAQFGRMTRQIINRIDAFEDNMKVRTNRRSSSPSRETFGHDFSGDDEGGNDECVKTRTRGNRESFFSRCSVYSNNDNGDCKNHIARLMEFQNHHHNTMKDEIEQLKAMTTQISSLLVERSLTEKREMVDKGYPAESPFPFYSLQTTQIPSTTIYQTLTTTPPSANSTMVQMEPTSLALSPNQIPKPVYLQSTQSVSDNHLNQSDSSDGLTNNSFQQSIPSLNSQVKATSQIGSQEPLSSPTSQSLANLNKPPRPPVPMARSISQKSRPLIAKRPSERSMSLDPEPENEDLEDPFENVNVKTPILNRTSTSVSNVEINKDAVDVEVGYQSSTLGRSSSRRRRRKKNKSQRYEQFSNENLLKNDTPTNDS